MKSTLRTKRLNLVCRPGSIVCPGENMGGYTVGPPLDTSMSGHNQLDLTVTGHTRHGCYINASDRYALQSGKWSRHGSIQQTGKS